MSIATRINAIEEHIRNAYDKIDDLGIDLTGVDKNINNIAEMLDTVYEDYPKVTGTGTEITLDGTKVGKLSLDIKGNSTQETTTGKNILNPRVIDGTKAGITYSYDSDTGIYTFNGTCTAEAEMVINNIATDVIDFINGTTTVSVHYISGSTTGGNVQFLTSNYSGVVVNFANLSSSTPILSQTATSTYTATLFNSRIKFISGVVVNNLKIKIMVANSTDTTYEPYTGRNS